MGNRVKNVIIGGGLSGLSLAYFLKDDDYLILESEERLGGYCKTIQNKHYVWDYAGHFYHFRNEEFRKLFLSFVPESEIVTKHKNTKIYYKDKLIDYPFQTNIHELSKAEFIDCLYDLYFRTERQVYDNFLDMLYGKFGVSITEKFLKPYNEKLYATDLNTLDSNAMGRFFPYADFDDVIMNMRKKQTQTYNDTFLYLKKGTGYFIDRLVERLDHLKIRTSTRATHVNLLEKTVTTDGGEKISYENLVNTAPLNHFLRLVDGNKYDGILHEMSYNKVLVLNLGFDRPSKRYTNEHWVYFPDKTLNFYRIGFYSNILDTDKLSVYVEIGFGPQQGIDVEKQLDATLKNMKKVGIISDNTVLLEKNVIIMDPAYVHIESETSHKLDVIFRQLEDSRVYSLGRYGKWTYSSMEDCMQWAEKLSQNLK